MSSMSSNSALAGRAAWAARFGWLLGGLGGTVAGFVSTWVLETKLLPGRVADPAAAAMRASSVLVGAMFFAGALAGHGFGARGGASRYRLLASAAGVAVAVALWAVLVLAR